MSDNISWFNSKSMAQLVNEQEHTLDEQYKQGLTTANYNPDLTVDGNIAWNEEDSQNILSAEDIAKQNSSSFREYQYNLRKNDPNAYRKKELETASERNQQLLVGKQVQRANDMASWLQSAMPRSSINEELLERGQLDSMSGSERLQNYLARKEGNPDTVDDIEFAQDINSLPIETLKARYGSDVAEYAFQKNKETMDLLAQRTHHAVGEDTDILSWTNIKDTGLGILAKGTRSIGSVANAIDLAINGKNAVERIANEEGFWDGLTHSLEENQSAGTQASRIRESTDEKYFDTVQEKRTRELMQSGMKESQAKSKAQTERTWNQFVSVFDEGDRLFRQASELLSDVVLGGLVAKGTAMLAKGATKAVVQNFLKKEIQRETARIGKEATEAGTKRALKETTDDLLATRMASVKSQEALKSAGKGKGFIDTKINPNRTAIASKARADVANSPLVQQQARSIGKAEGITAKTAYAIEATKKMVKDVEEISTQVSKLAATAGVTVYGSNQEAMDSVGSAYNLVAGLDNDKFLRTKKGTEIGNKLAEEAGYESVEEALRDKNFVTKLEDAKRDLAKTASLDAYKKVFADSALVNAFTSKAELSVGGVATRASGIKQHLKDFMLKTLGEGTEEFVESSSGDRRPKESANKVLDQQVYDPEKQATALGLKGAVTAMLGTSGLNAMPLGAKGLKQGKEKVTESLQKRQEKLKNQTANQELTNAFGSNNKPDATNTGSNPTPDKPNDGSGGATVSPNSEYEFSRTNLGEESQDSVGLRASRVYDKDFKNFGEVVDTMREDFSNAQKHLQQGNLEEVTKWNERRAKINEVLDNSIAQNNATHHQFMEFLGNLDNTVEEINNTTNVDDKTKLEKDLEETLDAHLQNVPQELKTNIITREDKLNTIKSLYTQAANQYLSQAEEQSSIREKHLSFLMSDLEQPTSTENTVSTDDIQDTDTKSSSSPILQRIRKGTKVEAKELDDGSIELNIDGKTEKVSKEDYHKELEQALLDFNSLPNLVSGSEKSILKHTMGQFNKLRYLYNKTSKNPRLDILFNTLDKVAKHIEDGAINNNEARTLIGTLFGNTGSVNKNLPNLGLVSYLQKAIHNGGSLNASDTKKLNGFYNSQITKLNKLNEALAKAKENPNKPIKLKLSDKDTAKELEFEDIKALQSYITKAQRVFNDVKSFHKELTTGELKQQLTSKQIKSDKEIDNKSDSKLTESVDKKKTSTQDISNESSQEDNNNSTESSNATQSDSTQTEESESIDTDANKSNSTLDSVDYLATTLEINFDKLLGSKTVSEILNTVNSTQLQNIIRDVIGKARRVANIYLKDAIKDRLGKSQLNMQSIVNNSKLPSATKEFLNLLELNNNPSNEDLVKYVIAKIFDEAILNRLLTTEGTYITNGGYKNNYGLTDIGKSTVKNTITELENYLVHNNINLNISDTSLNSVNSLLSQQHRVTAIHNYLIKPINQKWINNKEGKTEAELEPFTYKIGEQEYVIPMWVANELRLRGLDLNNNVLDELKIEPRDSIISSHYRELMNLSDKESMNNILEALQDNSEETQEYVKHVSQTLKMVQEYLTKNIPELFKQDSNSQSGLGLNGLLNFIQIYERDSEKNIIIPRELVQVLTAGLVEAMQSFDSISSGNTRTTDEFLLDNDYIVKAFNVTNGTKNAKEIELNISTLGSNINHFTSQLGKQIAKQLGIKDKASNLYQGLFGSLGIEVLNILNENGVIKQTKVSQFDGENEVASYNFVNTTWNWGINENNSKAQALKELTKPLPENTLNKLLGIESKDNKNQVVYLKDQVVEHKAIKKDASGEIVTGNDKNKLSRLDTFNKQEWSIDEDYLNLEQNLGQLFDFATEYTDLNTAILSDKSKESKKSKNTQLQRAKEKLQDLIKEGIALGGKLSDIRFRGFYEMSANGRIFMKSVVNPQNLKYHREMMNLVQQGKAPDWKVTSAMKSEPIGKLAQETNDENIKMFALSLAQALGIKIEKSSFQSIYQQLDKVMDNSLIKDMYELVGKAARNKVPMTEANTELAKQFQEEFGSGSYRALKALMTLSKLRNAKEGSQFESNLFLEADGIGNGMHNIIMQFNTGLTVSMLEGLTKTGVITLERIAEAYQKSQANNENKTLLQVMEELQGSAEVFSSDLTNNTVKDVYASVASEMAKDLQTSYENIVSGLVTLNEIVGHSINNVQDFIEQDGNVKIEQAIASLQQSLDEAETQEELNQYSEAIQHIRNIKNSINTILVLDLSGSLKGGYSNKDMKSLLQIPFADFGSKKGNNFVNTLIAEISRSFAKAGVTPATYGGKLNGITQQLIKNVKEDVQALADKLLKDSSTGSTENLHNNWNKFITILYSMGAIEANETILVNKNTKEAYNFKLNQWLDNKRIQEYLDAPEIFKGLVNGLLDKFNTNKRKVSENLKYSASSLLNKAVSTIYGESLDLASKFLSLTEPMFDMFHDEFMQQVQAKTNERNLKKGYAVKRGNKIVIIDPKGYDPLTKAEYRSIFRSMKTLPVVATAYSNNDNLLNQLINTGNDNVKTSYNESTIKSSVSSLYKGNATQLHISAVVRQLNKEFAQAGASTFTNTVVSVESKSQSDLQEKLAKMGFASLDVFDGSDAVQWLANMIGQYINQASYDNHHSYSVMEALFQMYNNSELSVLASTNIPNLVDDDVYNDKALQQVKLIKGLLSILSQDNKLIRRNLESLNRLMNSSKVTAKSLNNAWKELKESVGNLNNFYIAGMNELKFNTAQHHATMAIVAEMPMIYNQFAGANRGVVLNADSKYANELLNQVVNENVKDLSGLSKLITSSEHISKLYSETLDKHLSRLKLNVDNQPTIQFKSINELLTKLESRDTGSNTGALSHVIKHILDKLLPKNVYITSDKEQFIKRVMEAEESLNESAHSIVEKLSNSDGLYVPEVGIWVSNLNDTSLVLHELLHVALKQSLGSHYLDGKTNDTVMALERSAIELQRLFKGDSTFTQLMQELASDSSLDAQYAFNKLDPLRAGVAYLVNAINQNDGSQQAREKVYEAMQEFIAYGLTEYESINQLSKLSIANTKGMKNALSKLGTIFNIIRKWINKLFGITNPKDESALHTISSLVGNLTNTEFTGSSPSLQKASKQFTAHNNVADIVLNINEVNDNIDNEQFLNQEQKGYLKEYASKLYDNLKELLSAYRRNNESVFNYPDLVDKFFSDSHNQELQDYLVKARSLGLSISEAEEKLFMLNGAMIKNTELPVETNLINEIASFVEPSSFIGGLEQFKHIFSDPVLAGILISTNTKLRDYLSNVKVPKKQKQKITDFMNRKPIEYVEGNFDLDSLANAVNYIDLRNRFTHEAQEELMEKNFQQDRADMKTMDKIDKLLGGNSITEVIGAVAKTVISGKDREAHKELKASSSEQSFIGDVIDSVLLWNMQTKGRDTIAHKFMSWLLGERKDTHDIAKAHSEHLANIDIVRERLFKTTKKGLLEIFDNKLSKEEDKILHTMVRIGLNELNQYEQFSVEDFNHLNEPQYLRHKRQDIEQAIKQVIEDNITGSPKVKEQIFNYLSWQTSGLADLQRDNQAKASGNTHGILPNTKVIASLQHIKDDLKFKASDNLETELLNQLGALTAIKSIQGMNEVERNELQSFVKNNVKQVRKFLHNAQRIKQESLNHGTYLGRDGYTTLEQDSHYNLVVRSVNQDNSDLTKLGYELKSELSNGDLVYSSNGAFNNKYKTGMFSFTEYTSNGVNTNDYSIRGMATKTNSDKDNIIIHNSFNSSLRKALVDSNYYDNLSQVSNVQPIINELGQLIGYESAVPYELHEELIPTTLSGVNSLSRNTARNLEERFSEYQNRKYIDLLQNLYKNSNDKTKFIRVDGEYSINRVHQNKLDKAFVRKLNSFYRMLPQETKAYIESNGGLYIPISEVDNIVGYHETWISDVFTDKSYFPEPVQKTIRAVFEVFGTVTGTNPAKIARQSETLLREVTSLSKDYILNRSLTVPLANMISNVLHLVQWGIPLTEIPKLIKEGYIKAKEYQKDIVELDKVRFELKQLNIGVNKKLKLQAQEKALTQKISANEVRPLVQGGILTSISALDIEADKSDYSYLNQIGNKIGFNAIKDKTPEVINSLLIREDSKSHKLLTEMLDYGDFVAKYALYKHLQKQGKSSYHAMNIIREEFIDYSRNRGAFFDMMNATGMTWFLNYKLAIQKIIFRSFRRNFLRTSAIMASDKVVEASGLDPLDLYQTVPSQTMTLGNVMPFGSYHTSPHLIDGFESHYLSKLLQAIF